MWLCILSDRLFEDTFENTQWRMQAILVGWKYSGEKLNKCNQCYFASSHAFYNSSFDLVKAFDSNLKGAIATLELRSRPCAHCGKCPKSNNVFVFGLWMRPPTQNKLSQTNLKYIMGVPIKRTNKTKKFQFMLDLFRIHRLMISWNWRSLFSSCTLCRDPEGSWIFHLQQNLVG